MSVSVALPGGDAGGESNGLPSPDEEGAGGRVQGRTAKSLSAFRTISEVADDLDVAQHVLRFWESKFPQVRPLKRGGGRRYYRPEDVDTLRRIRVLLYDEGYTIKGAQRLLRTRRTTAVEPPAGRRTTPQPAPHSPPGVSEPAPPLTATAPAPELIAAPQPAPLVTPPAETVSTPVLNERRRLARQLRAELGELHALLRAALDG
ncbi:MerR HTH family regulatory protein [Arboricoccus pini]|uniref:MerR HTH family regulatory protein n=1 Tax=Arboricoccus pini TaxID=1963835 RepID=A0A212PYT4_9PROT|nr:MerR family transcriptional regulator [Arboricoccus pini]SNB52265.1 MerR HTH family regulatory protein [Arboricoccus pini]